MKKKTKLSRSKRSDEPIGDLHRIVDFLPPPKELLPQEKVTKITLTVDVDTIEAFKEMADECGTKYQRMMREALKGYAKKYGT
jgi:predicted DNA binding CopG/RHH family protein